MNRKEFFDSHADKWDEYFDEEKFTKIKILIEMSDIQKEDCLLDIGCGTGVLLPLIKKICGDTCDVLALDISFQMLKKVKEKFHDRFPCVQCDAEDISFKNHTFNKVICYSCFPHFPDKKEALLEIERILKPGGYVFILHSDSRKSINDLHKNIGSVVVNDFLPDERNMMYLLLKAGFENIHIYDSEEYYFAAANKPGLTLKETC